MEHGVQVELQHGEVGPGTSKEVATEKKQLGVAPRQSSRFGLVCAPARREVENSGYRQSWGEVGVAGFLVSSLAKGGASTRMNKAKPWSNDCRTIRYGHRDGIFSIRRCTYDITIL